MQLKDYDLDIILQKCHELIKKASAEVMNVYNDSFDVTLKKDKSPLTTADILSNDIINRGLQSLTPDIPIISEENLTVPYATRSNYETMWLIDPIDGTKEFVKKNGEFAIHIGLVHQHIPILGVIAFPALGVSVTAIKGRGAHLHSDGQDITLSIKDKSKDDSFSILASRSHISNKVLQEAARYHHSDLIQMGSSLKFIKIATNQADYYPRFGPTMEWDTAAPQVILEEAGGHVLDFNSRTPLRYNKESLVNPDFFAVNHLHLLD